MHKICPFFNLFFWTLYLMVIVGYRRIKHYLVMLGVMLVLFVLYAKFVGIKTVYRGRDRSSASVNSLIINPVTYCKYNERLLTQISGMICMLKQINHKRKENSHEQLYHNRDGLGESEARGLRH